MSWMGVITNAGQSLLDQWLIGGHSLTILGATVGSGITPAVNMRSATALANEEDDASIIGTEEADGATKFKVQVSGAPTTAYVAHEIGIWAKLDNGARTLLSLHQDADTGVAIPKKADAPNFAFVLYAVHSIDNDETLVVNIDETAFVSTGTFNSAISELEEGKLDTDGDSADCTVAFTSGDAASPTAWTDVDVVASGETHSSLLNKITTMIKNIRWLHSCVSPIGATAWGTKTGSTKVLQDTTAQVGTITLSAMNSVWIVSFQAKWDDSNKSAGYRQIAYEQNDANPDVKNAVSQHAAGGTGKNSYQQLVALINVPAASVTLKMYARHGTSDSIYCYPYIYAVRIK